MNFQIHFKLQQWHHFAKDEEKYNVVDELTKEIEKTKNEKTKIDDQIINHILKINGVRFSFEDGSWGLIRASSNKPSLVIVTESPTSNDRKKRFLILLIICCKKLEKLETTIKKYKYL